MATYLVGDIQGCFAELQALLERVEFDSTIDHLYLAGDLVARGPDSLAVLRFIKNLGEHAHTVLGNHDLHLLAVNAGFAKNKAKDKTLPILQAEDKDELLLWLRQQPLLIHYPISNDSAPGFILSHAGIPPTWDLSQAKTCAQEVEAILQSNDYLWLLENMYGDEPKAWSESLSSIERFRFTINALTRMRFCDNQGHLDMKCKFPPQDVDNKILRSWFSIENRKPVDETVIFGHWAALNGYFSDKFIGLDTGCVWGGSLTMLRWEDRALFSTPSTL